MRSLLRTARRRHGTVAAYLALVTAMSGTAYAAATITSEKIVDGTIQTVDLKALAVDIGRLAPDAVSSTKVVDETIQGRDVANGMLSGDDLKNASVKSADVALDTRVVEDSVRVPNGPGSFTV